MQHLIAVINEKVIDAEGIEIFIDSNRNFYMKTNSGVRQLSNKQLLNLHNIGALNWISQQIQSQVISLIEFSNREEGNKSVNLNQDNIYSEEKILKEQIKKANLLIKVISLVILVNVLLGGAIISYNVFLTDTEYKNITQESLNVQVVKEFAPKKVLPIEIKENIALFSIGKSSFYPKNNIAPTEYSENILNFAYGDFLPMSLNNLPTDNEPQFTSIIQPFYRSYQEPHPSHIIFSNNNNDFENRLLMMDLNTYGISPVFSEGFSVLVEGTDSREEDVTTSHKIKNYTGEANNVFIATVKNEGTSLQNCFINFYSKESNSLVSLRRKEIPNFSNIEDMKSNNKWFIFEGVSSGKKDIFIVGYEVVAGTLKINKSQNFTPLSSMLLEMKNPNLISLNGNNLLISDEDKILLVDLEKVFTTNNTSSLKGTEEAGFITNNSFNINKNVEPTLHFSDVNNYLVFLDTSNNIISYNLTTKEETIVYEGKDKEISQIFSSRNRIYWIEEMENLNEGKRYKLMITITT